MDNLAARLTADDFHKDGLKIEKIKTPYTWLIFKIKEGKNREIRNICDYFLWRIVNLVRIQYGPIKLIKQKPGEIIEIKKIHTDL